MRAPPPPSCVDDRAQETSELEADVVPFVTDGPFTVAIEQGGRRHSLAGHEVTIERAPFDLVVELRTSHAVLVDVALDDAMLVAARDGRPLRPRLRPTETYAESLFDADEDLMLDGQPFRIADGRCWIGAGHQYLYWDSPEEHRFTSVTWDGATLIGRRHVERLWRSDNPWVADSKVTLANTDDPALYLVLLEDSSAADEMTTPLERAWARVSFR